MNDLIEFLTSKEIIVVYLVAAFACLLCFVIYTIDKNYYKRRQKHNTKELNKIVESVNAILGEEEKEEEESISYETPVLENITPEPVQVAKEELLVEETTPIVLPQEVLEVKEPVIERLSTEPIVEERHEKLVAKEEPELEYTTAEPNREEAQKELMRLTEELAKAEQASQNNIELTSYEIEQEENAIISIEELEEKTRELYELNELDKYEDEGSAPISISDLEAKMKDEQPQATYEEPVIIRNITDAEMDNLNTAPITEQLSLDDMVKKEEAPKAPPLKDAYKATKKFKNSPVISPIYGIEHTPSNQDIELENTADYEKLDAELKKSNDFRMTMRELQNNIE